MEFKIVLASIVAVVALLAEMPAADPSPGHYPHPVVGLDWLSEYAAPSTKQKSLPRLETNKRRLKSSSDNYAKVHHLVLQVNPLSGFSNKTKD